MSIRYFESPAEALRSQAKKADAFRHKVLKAVEWLQLPPRRRRRLRALLGVRDSLHDIRLCDMTAREKAAEILFEVVHERRDELFAGGVRVHHITFIDDLGVTSDRTPQLRIRSFKRKVDKALRSMCMSGLIFMEVQPLLNYPGGGRGRTLLLHAHALCWQHSSRRGFQRAKEKLNNSRSWKSQFGAEPVHSRRIRRISGALQIVTYISKLPHDGKYRKPHSDGTWRFRGTMKDYPNCLALRIVEGLSHYSIFDAVFSVGDARGIRLEWKRRLVAWQRQRTARRAPLAPFDIPSFWSRVRRSPRANYKSGFQAN